MAKKLSKKPETPAERLKQIPLWQWGMFLIMAGVAANLVMGLMPAPPAGSDEARGQAFGRIAATLLFVIAGVVLIILFFVRGGPKKPGRLR